jgi:hypothetical protein
LIYATSYFLGLNQHNNSISNSALLDLVFTDINDLCVSLSNYPVVASNNYHPQLNLVFKLILDSQLIFLTPRRSYRQGDYLLLYIFFFHVALQSLKDLGHLTYRKFLELFRHMVVLLERVISSSQGLYLHGTTQHRKTRTNIHALSGIRTHNPSNQPAKTHASYRTATVTRCFIIAYLITIGHVSSMKILLILQSIILLLVCLRLSMKLFRL